MKPPLRLFFVLLAAAAAVPAGAAWEELRRNDQVRLSIDPQSIRRTGDTVRFRYLVDFREPQGDLKTVVYRSLATRVRIRCNARTILTEDSEAYGGVEARGPSLGVQKTAKKDLVFKKLEEGTSDEDLYKRVCEARPAAAPAKPKT